MRVLSVYLIVADLDRSVAFYRALFGRTERAVIPLGPDARGAFFELDDGTRVILAREGDPPDVPKRPHLFVEWEIDGPDAECARLRAAGVKLAQDVHLTPGGSRAFHVEDPDGNRWRVGTRWPL